MFLVVSRLVRYPPQGGCLVDPRSYSVRRELPLRASYHCHPLPLVIGFPDLGVL